MFMLTLAFIENFGLGEWLILLILIVLIFPGSARKAGQFMGRTSSGGGTPPTPPPQPASTLSPSANDELYRTLDLQPNASFEEIRRAYKELAKVWHPDRFGHDEKLRERATQKLQQINAAYEKLCAIHGKN